MKNPHTISLFSVNAFPKWKANALLRRDATLPNHKYAKCKCKKVQHTFVLRQSCQRHQLSKRRLSLPLSTQRRRYILFAVHGVR